MEKLHTNQTGGSVAGAPENAKKKMPPWLAGLIGLAVIVGVYGILKLLIWTEVISIYYADYLNLILINMILGLGLNLITGITGQFSLGHAGFMAVGAYTTALVVLNTSGSLVSILGGILLGAVLAGLLGLLVGIPTLRLKGDYLAIATLGLGEIIRIFITNTDQKVLGGSAGLSGFPIFTTFEMAFFGAAITFVVVRNLLKSSYGRACVAVREDEIAAESMGVNLAKVKIMAFVVGTFFAGMAGGLFTGYMGIIQPKSFDFMKSIDILMIVVLGGLGNIWGTLVGAIVLGIVNIFLQDLSSVRMIVYALLLVIIMLVKSGDTRFFVWLRKLFNWKKWTPAFLSKKSGVK